MRRVDLSGLVAAAAAPYRAAGRFAWHFAQGKLAGDPVFSGLLRRGLIPDGAHLLDLGCGQGLLAAWLLAAHAEHAAGRWPLGWPPPPRLAAYRGVELLPAEADRARAALGGSASIATGDMRTADLGAPDTVVILDVLHFILHGEQADLLARIHSALPPDGLLLLRAGNAQGGLEFAISQWVDRLVAFFRGHGWIRFYCRGVHEWEALLRDLGFSVEHLRMDQGTPFANTLFICRKAVPNAATAKSASGR